MLEMLQLITTSEARGKARDIGQNISDSKINVFIQESENIDLKSALGDALFLDMKENPDAYAKLLDGGEYSTNRGERRAFSGLKSALAYYVYARIVKNGDGHVTRIGFVNKESEYSSRPDIREKVMAYNDAFGVADRYLKECVRYLNDCKDEYPLYKGNGGIKANRTIFRILGE